MKKHVIILGVLTIISLALIATDTRAGWINGNELYKKCTVKESSELYFMDSSYCLGYIMAVTEVYLSSGKFYKISCIPGEVDPGQLKDILVKYLRDHPEKRHLSGYALIMESQVAAFPCNKETSK